MRLRKKSVGLVAAAALAFGGAAAPMAHGQQTGLVNITVGEITIQDVGIGVAANLAANACGNQVNVGVIARQLARNGGFTCSTGAQSVTITQ